MASTVSRVNGATVAAVGLTHESLRFHVAFRSAIAKTMVAAANSANRRIDVDSFIVVLQCHGQSGFNLFDAEIRPERIASVNPRWSCSFRSA